MSAYLVITAEGGCATHEMIGITKTRFRSFTCEGKEMIDLDNKTDRARLRIVVKNN